MYIRRPLCVFSLLFVLILAAIMSINGSIGTQETDTTRIEGRVITVNGTIRRIEDKNNKTVVHIKNTSKTNDLLSKYILIYFPEDYEINRQLHIGQDISVRGRFEKWDRAYNRGQFDMREYYTLKHYGGVLYDPDVIGKSASYNRLTDTLYRIKCRTMLVYGKYLDDRYSGIVKALVLAERADIDRELKEQFKNAGISHILALSGLHIVTMGFMLYSFIRRLGGSGITAAPVSTVIIVLYCIMTGMPTSAVRALIMYLLSMVALVVGRTPDMRTSAAIAAVIMLVINPDYLYDAAFLLSFSAVLGIGLVYPSVRSIVMYLLNKDRIIQLHRSDKRTVRMVMAVLRALLFSASIQLATMPVTMWFYYQIPTYGIFVNIVVIPLTGVLLLGSIATGVFGYAALRYLHGSSYVFDLITRLCACITSLILKLYDSLTSGVCRLPGGIIITGRPKPWQIFIYYALLITVTAGGYILVGKERRLVREARKDGAGIGYGHGRQAGAVTVNAALLIALCAVATVILFARTEPEFELSSLYVGQGQCFVMHGRDIPTIMYDCGSTDIKEAAGYNVVPFLKFCGLDRIDTVFISHLDTDHVSGLMEMLDTKLRGITVGRIVIPDGEEQKKTDNYRLLTEAAADRGVPVYRMKKGETVRWRHLSAECLSPDGGGMYEDMNDASLVLGIDYKGCFRALFTGDIGLDTEDRILGTGLQSYDWVQIPHHGSRNGANERFIKSAVGSMAVISAGRNNQYGHPHKETLDMLKNNTDIHTYITSQCGETDINIEQRGGSVKGIISTFLDQTAL
ncbi:MAG: ComEC/Rec2 family competence protein [Lachnospiraceae bacterium]|nr:ComEC/Rec2 family competence protein [Lachnospiraceae bacterium]